MTDHCVIVGGGHGGAQLCASLRQNDYSGRITMVSKDACLPYHRPPLSKAFLKNPALETQIIKPQAFYDDNDIELMLGKTATSIHCSSNEIEMADGKRLNYSKLVLSTGAKARLLNIPGTDAQGVHYLKFAEDAVQLRSELASAENVGVIGGGFIGLEAAATFASLGKQVTVFEAGERLLGRAVSPEISAYFLAKHRSNGMDIRLKSSVKQVAVSDNKVTGIESDGEIVKAEIVLIGIGVAANCEFAELAGIKCENGIIVDSNMLTSDPNILAIGDCVSFEHWQTGTRVRLESVQNANDQARNAAMTLAGKAQPYSEVPWFWSDQGEDKLQIVGLSNDSDRRVVQNQSESNKMTVYHFVGPKLVAIDTVNNPAEHMIGRRLLSGETLPAYSEVNAEGFDLMTYYKSIQ